MQSLARMDVTLLALFEALEAERNLTRAAARLGMAQPSASKALDRLRDLFADPLFLRMPGGMRPTPRAVELTPQIGAVLARLRALVAEELPFDPASARGRLRIAMSDTAELMLLPRLVGLLTARAPQLTLQARPLDKDRAFLLLDEGRLDAVIGVFPERPKRIEALPLFTERFVCLARADHPALAAGLSLEAFTTLPHLLVTLRDDARGAVDDALSRIGRQRRVLATMARFLAIPAVLARSDAIATVPARFAAGVQGCRQHEPPIPIPGWTEQLLWRAGAERDPLTGWALALIREAAREDEAGLDQRARWHPPHSVRHRPHPNPRAREPMITLHGIKNCDTMKKARAWLDAKGVAYAFHDYKTQGIAPETLAAWVQELGWEALLNRAGTTFRKLPEEQKQGLDAARAIALMLAQPSMIKRPVLDLGPRRLVGFNAEAYATALG